MKVVESHNNVSTTVMGSDGQLVKLQLKLNAEHGFLSLGALYRPHQARRLADAIKAVADGVDEQGVSLDGKRI